MTGEKLEFRMRSGGTATFDLEKCADCDSRACLIVCNVQGGPLTLDEVRAVPTLRWSASEIERGGCIECLGCELDCTLYGRQAVTIDLPLPGLDEYLCNLTESLVYKR